MPPEHIINVTPVYIPLDADYDVRRVTIKTVLGGSINIDEAVCKRCGSLVGSMTTHDAWHERIENHFRGGGHIIGPLA